MKDDKASDLFWKRYNHVYRDKSSDVVSKAVGGDHGGWSPNVTVNKPKWFGCFLNNRFERQTFVFAKN